MRDCVIILALSLLVGLVAPFSGQNCDVSSAAARCSRAFVNYDHHNGTSLVLNDVLPSWNKSQLQQLCVAYKPYLSCMKTVADCSLDKRLTLDGLNDTFEYLCTDSATAEYLAHHACFANSTLRHRVDSCNETFQAKSSPLHPLSDSAEIRQYCTYYDEYLTCVDKAVEPICGDDASKWQKNHVNKLHQPVLNYIGCSTSGGGTNSDSGWSPVTIVMSVFIIMIIVFMIIIIAAFLAVAHGRWRRSAGGRRGHGRGGRRRRGSAGTVPPDYDAPYVIYGEPGPNGERRMRIVGLGDGSQPTSVDAAAFKGAFVEPPPYIEEPPPAFSAVHNHTSDDAEASNADTLQCSQTDDKSTTEPDASGTSTDVTDSSPN